MDNYHSEQAYEKVGVVANDVEGLAAQVHKTVKLFGRFVTPVDHIRHVRGQYKRHTIPNEIICLIH